MTRGNQRDTDRARAQKRKDGKGVPAKEKDGLTASQRKERSGTRLWQAGLLMLLAQCTSCTACCVTL